MQNGLGKEARAREDWDTAMLLRWVVKGQQLNMAARALGAGDTHRSTIILKVSPGHGLSSLLPHGDLGVPVPSMCCLIGTSALLLVWMRVQQPEP